MPKDIAFIHFLHEDAEASEHKNIFRALHLHFLTQQKNP